MKNLSFIIPLHGGGLLKERAVSLCGKISEFVDGGCGVVLVGCQSDIDAVSLVLTEKLGIDGSRLIASVCEGDYFDMVNSGVFACPDKYFSVIHLEDTVSGFWLSKVDEYISAYGQKYSAYLPITENVDRDGVFVGFSNEIVHSTSFAENLGEITLESLEDYFEYTLTGGVFKTEDFISCGGIKKSFKCCALYEFLLRFVYNGHAIFVIPRAGYTRCVDAEESFKRVIEKSSVSKDEYDALVVKCRGEYLFKHDRNQDGQV